MKHKYFLHSSFIYFVLICACSVNSKNKESHNPNRVYFDIEHEIGKIIIPILFQDSITTNLMFDTGWSGIFTLSSYIDSAHPTLISNNYDTIINVQRKYSSWTSNHILIPALHYKNTSLTGKLRNIDIAFKDLVIRDFPLDGAFNIPENDSTHIWELNFENNYLEIHNAGSFCIPKNCYSFAIERDPVKFYIEIPLQLKYADADTLTLNRRFLVDTGAEYDVALVFPSKEEADFFRKKDDAIHTISGDKEYRARYTADAMLFDYSIDSLRIYTFTPPLKNFFAEYVLGLNFLKRFNLYFDMKNKQLALQPIDNFKRIEKSNLQQFYYFVDKTSDDKYIVTDVADSKYNFFKTAGMQEGDEIVSINGTSFKDIKSESKSRQKLDEADTFIMGIMRNGIYLELIVPVDFSNKHIDL